MSAAPPIRSTARLALREFTRDDADALYGLDSDPRVMRFLGGVSENARQLAIESVERIMARYAATPGLGAWHASRRDTGAFIGWISLKHAGDSPDIEIGYRLRADAWGHGFATELGLAMVFRGFDELGLARIIGVTHPENLASQHVLRKIGMRDEGWGHYYDKDLRLFAIERA